MYFVFVLVERSMEVQTQKQHICTGLCVYVGAKCVNISNNTHACTFMCMCMYIRSVMLP